MTHEERKMYIRKRFPQLELVKRREWADAACEIWADLWEQSSWKVLDEVPANPLTPTASLINHVQAVVENCIHVAKIRESLYGDNVDMDVLIMGAVLHDASKVIEFEWRDGGEVVSKLGELYQHGFYAACKALESKLPDEIVHIILTHTGATRVCPKTVEGLVLCYCDMVDSDLNRLRDGSPLLITSHK
jgi:putative nucleotidyltransferase with HDIG domain